MSLVGDILRRDHTPVLIAVATAVTPWLLATGSPAAAVVWSTLLFTAFDLSGFTHVLRGEQGETVAYYRIMQTMFQAVLYVAVWRLAGLPATAATAAIWWFGGCDLLFYAAGKHPMYYGSWHWLWWTPYGLCSWAVATVSGRRGATVPWQAVIAQAVVGVAAAVWILVRW